MNRLLALLLFVPSLCLAQLPDGVPTGGLVAWYSFNGNAEDQSGNGHHGVVSGASPSIDENDAPSGSYFFDGNARIDIDDHDDFDWVEMTILITYQDFDNPAAYPNGNSNMVSKVPGSGWGSGFGFGLGGDMAEFGRCMTTTSGNECLAWGENEYGEWRTVAYTHSIDSVKVYFDAFLVYSEEASGGFINNDLPITIGMRGNGWHEFIGSISRLAFWNRALTEAEIQALMLGEAPEYGCTDTNACNYDETADADDGSCEYGCLYCGEGTVWDSTLAQCISIATPCAPSCGEGTVWDPVNEECIIAIPADLNYDGCVSVNDLLLLLAVHGTCPPYPEWPEEPVDTSNCPPGAFDQLQQDLNGEGWSWLGEYNTAQYFVSTNPISWDNAQSLAAAYGGHLVVIESQDENDWISTAVGDEYIWIGLYQDTSSVEYSEPAGGWTWVNGAESTYTNWAGNAPNEVNGLENACQMYSNGFWNDAPGDYFLDGSDGRDIYAVIEFSSACPAPDWTCGDPVTYWDYDYATVLIGDQCWFAENLRTALYSNGDSIPSGLTDAEWANTISGATAIYGEGSSNCGDMSPDIDACDELQSLEYYGRLYNGYSVNDERGLCLEGWHVSTDGDWTILENHVAAQGFAGMEGSALKSTTGWYNNGNGTDEFGFSALPGGYRSNVTSGNYIHAGLVGHWWSTLEVGTRTMAYTGPDLDLHYFSALGGFSVRCVKD